MPVHCLCARNPTCDTWVQVWILATLLLLSAGFLSYLAGRRVTVWEANDCFICNQAYWSVDHAKVTAIIGDCAPM
jgi:hypothetical protein